MSTDSKDFFEGVLEELMISQSSFDLIRRVPESINKPNDMAYLTKNTEGPKPPWKNHARFLISY